MKKILVIKISDKFYEVKIIADIQSSKQDRGDRLYWVESIGSVTYKEIDKPLPKEKEIYTYSFELNKDEKNYLEDWLIENNYKFKTNGNI